jgi:hypothetical protein
MPLCCMASLACMTLLSGPIPGWPRPDSNSSEAGPAVSCLAARLERQQGTAAGKCQRRPQTCSHMPASAHIIQVEPRELIRKGRTPTFSCVATGIRLARHSPQRPLPSRPIFNEVSRRAPLTPALVHWSSLPKSQIQAWIAVVALVTRTGPRGLHPPGRGHGCGVVQRCLLATHRSPPE